MIDWTALSQQSQTFSNLATTVSAVIAAVALALGAVQIWVSARTAREASALQAYRDYLRLCFENPSFSSTELFEQSYPDEFACIGTPDRSANSEKYEWMVSILVTSCEEIITNVSSKGEWRSAMVAQLSYHARTLEKIWPDVHPHYDRCMDALVQDAIALDRGIR